MRIYMLENGKGFYTQCLPDTPGAIPFDKASGKETPEGRVVTLVAALNAALMLVPGKRVTSTGTRLEVRDAGGGQYADPGIATVAEFHTVFGAHIGQEPGMGWSEGSSAPRSIQDFAEWAAETAEALKVAAASANREGDPGGGRLLVRLQLIQEELAELADAMARLDIVEGLDALVDLSYVVDGTYLTLGLGHYKLPGLEEVHRSNMSKLGDDGRPIISDAGRVVKGPHYMRPDLRSVLGLPAGGSPAREEVEQGTRAAAPETVDAEVRPDNSEMLRALWDELSSHNWFYSMSEVHSTWSAGFERERVLRDQASRAGEAGMRMYDQFHDAAWKGTDRPERP